MSPASYRTKQRVRGLRIRPSGSEADRQGEVLEKKSTSGPERRSLLNILTTTDEPCLYLIVHSHAYQDVV